MSTRGYFDDESDIAEEKKREEEEKKKQEEADENEVKKSAVIQETSEDVKTIEKEEEEDDEEIKMDQSTDIDSAFKFTIDDPSKTIRGKSYTFWVYKITAITSLKEYEHKNLTVQRRYSDFVWLRDQLHANNPGAIIPPIPGKNIVGALEKVFKINSRGLVDYRQRALTKFLTRVGGHNLLQKSNNLKLFLEMSFDDFQRLRQSSKVPKPKITFFKKSLSRVPDWIRENKDFNNKLEMGLKLLRTRLQEMIKRRKEIAKTMNDFGKAFHRLGEIEKEYEDNNLSQTLMDIGNKMTDDMASGVFVNRQTEKESMQVLETITYYIGMCGAIKTNCKNLENLRLIRDDLRHVLDKREIKLKTLRVTQPETAPKLVKLAGDIESLKERQAEANRIMIKAEKLFKNDMEKFDLEKKVDFAYMLDAFVNLQHDYHQSIKNSWKKIIPTIKVITNPQDE